MSKRFINGKEYQQVRLMYQDEVGFGRISKLGSCWSPKGYRPYVASHHIREYRYCYGAVDAHRGDSFFIIVGGCNTHLKPKIATYHSKWIWSVSILLFF